MKNTTQAFLSIPLLAAIISLMGCSPPENNTSTANNAAAAITADTSDEGGATDIHLTDDEMNRAQAIFFDRCAGCHGALRQGATGKPLTPDKTAGKTAYLESIIHNGTAGGMPDWGNQGLLTKEETSLMAKFIQLPPPKPIEWSIKDMHGSWTVNVPVDQRPKSAPEGKNWQNYFGVILRDAGKVAIIDGDSKELVTIIETGYAVHILRTSATGRYFYSIGRDGVVTMIDLWMSPPTKVAEVKACIEARSIDASKYHGDMGDFRDKYVVVGGYWPPCFIILDGQTLEPLKIHRTSDYTHDVLADGSVKVDYKEEARVASIVSSHHDPSWVLNVKEAGKIWLVDYSNIDALRITKIEADVALHDGGWDSTKRYFLVAANAKNKIAVIDTYEKKLVALIDTQGVKPHPGRGANFVHPKYGPVWATGHIGSNHITCIGTDPIGHRQNAWKVVEVAEMPEHGGGNLFIKTHDNSKHLWADRPLSNVEEHQTSIYVFDKSTMKLKKTLRAPEEFRKNARTVHMEYNMAGDEVWVSVWGGMKDKSCVLVYDDKTLELKKVITGDWCVTPTGKFNVNNTTEDKY